MDKTFYFVEIPFIGLTLFVVVLVILGLNYGANNNPKLKRTVKKFKLFLITWVLFLIILSLSGFTRNFDLFPLNMAPIMIIPIITLIFLTKSKKITAIIFKIPYSWFVLFQSFRIIVEVLLWVLFVQNLLPHHLTFEGKNWDIIAGFLGLVLGLFCFFADFVGRFILYTYNILGLLLLVNIVTMAILTLPTPIQMFRTEPNNNIFMDFPYVFLPGILVPAAYYAHVFLLKKVYLNKV